MNNREKRALLLAIVLLVGCAKMNGTVLYCIGMCLEVTADKEEAPIAPIIDLIEVITKP